MALARPSAGALPPGMLWGGVFGAGEEGVVSGVSNRTTGLCRLAARRWLVSALPDAPPSHVVAAGRPSTIRLHGVRGPSRLRDATPADLIDEHGHDDDKADHDVLPERRDTLDGKPVAQDGGDEGADDGPRDRARAPEEAGAADHRRGNGVEVVQAVPLDV